MKSKHVNGIWGDLVLDNSKTLFSGFVGEVVTLKPRPHRPAPC
jgi:hypothetical protein